tara:strand:- start:417 stop:956 length:540 start_codon:yes stop_codon:yes gene_type:complete
MEIIGCLFLKHNKKVDMKAKEINGNIKTYNRLPKTWEDESGLHLNFDKVEKPQDYGFYDVVMPTYDSVTQQISNLHFDKKKKAFVYDVTDKEFGQDLDTYKANKVSEVKSKAGDLLKATDWHVVRLAERAIDIPQDIKDERQAILDKADVAELEIAALESIAEVIKYNIVLVEQRDFLV